MSGLREAALVAAGGAAGALGRWWVSGVVYRVLGTAFPWGTLAVNVLGSFLLGFLLTVGLETAWVSPGARVAAGAGFLGAFTTFSTFSYETMRLVESGAAGRAAANALGSLALGLVACAAGMALARGLAQLSGGTP